jgi:hypothetical protein
MPKTPNHDYNVPNEGEKDWHQPLNDNFEQYDTDIEIRDTDGNRGNYNPKAGAKFLATDTEDVYVGTGSSWEHLPTSGREPNFDAFNVNGNFLGVGRNSRITTREYFGVDATVKAGDFGGMHVNTASADAKPFYGYGLDGDSPARHYYDGGQNQWRLQLGEDRLFVDDDFVGVGRSDQITDAEGFGVTVEGSTGDFGGMYAETTDAEGRPFYGYATDGTVQVYHDYDPALGEWGLSMPDGRVAVSDAGDLSVSGNKNFTQSVDTDDGEKEVVYTATEAGTPHTEASGVAELEEGRATVDLPEHFAWVTDDGEPLVVQVTPHASEPVSPQVTDRSADRIVVEDFGDGTGDYEVSYTVKGTREGQADKEVVREPSASAENPGAPASADD